jgi:hypothetical protein
MELGMKYLVNISIFLTHAAAAILGAALYKHFTKPEHECMRSYYAGMDVQICSKSVKCTTSNDEGVSMKICQLDNKL